MSLEIFLLLLLIVSIFTGLFTEGIKKLMDEVNKKYLSNFLAGFVAVVLSVLVDGLKIPVCNNCHNMGQKLCRIHENPMAERLSKMLGQAIWEKEWISANNQQESRKAREAFRKRYGRSYL